jgi:hypothetical protein
VNNLVNICHGLLKNVNAAPTTENKPCKTKREEPGSIYAYAGVEKIIQKKDARSDVCKVFVRCGFIFILVFLVSVIIG